MNVRSVSQMLFVRCTRFPALRFLQSPTARGWHNGKNSRKGTTRQAAATPADHVWRTEAYCPTFIGEQWRRGTDTIEVQMELVESHKSYIRKHSQLHLYDTYANNGESGKDFDRSVWGRLKERYDACPTDFYKATVWQTRSIKRIVEGRVYLGDLSQGKFCQGRKCLRADCQQGIMGSRQHSRS